VHRFDVVPFWKKVLGQELTELRIVVDDEKVACGGIHTGSGRISSHNDIRPRRVETDQGVSVVPEVPDVKICQAMHSAADKS
jgi:hypothetical protein